MGGDSVSMAREYVRQYDFERVLRTKESVCGEATPSYVLYGDVVVRVKVLGGRVAVSVCSIIESVPWRSCLQCVLSI